MTKFPHDSELENRFRYHPPTPEKVAAHEEVTESTLAMAKRFRDLLPSGRNLSIVLTLLEDVRMRANAAIACDWPITIEEADGIVQQGAPREE